MASVRRPGDQRRQPADGGLDPAEDLLLRLCRNPARYADRLEFAWIDDAAHFITDDAPGEVADLAVDWFARAA